MAIPDGGLDLNQQPDSETRGARLVSSGNIHLKRINDIKSPLITPITDDMPIYTILSM